MHLAALDGSAESSEEEALGSGGQNGIAGFLRVSIHDHLTLFWTKAVGQTDVGRRLRRLKRLQNEEGRIQDRRTCSEPGDPFGPSCRVCECVCLELIIIDNYDSSV